ncbi:FAR1 DNA binding domain, zinc finger, SWIM-type, MULE transposase domain containing protein, partial [Tanacetum coccineum]
EDDFEIVKVRDHVGFYVVSKDGTRTWRGLMLDEVNPKEKSSVKSLDVDISEHSEVSDGFERFRDPKKKQTRRKPMFRCGCLTSLTIKRIGNVFKVTSMIEGHNHPLVAEKDMIFMKNSRNIGYTKQHFLYQVSNANFGHAIGDDDRLVGLFWADEKAIRNYATFGDNVSFDATFRSNKYQMVFVPFTGINHHNCCITFASGLLADETAGAYICLLKQFKKAFGKDSEVVVTDQDPSIKIAIAECFPDTRHRLCMWHIMMKLGTKVGAVLYEMFASYKYCIALSVVQTENTETYSVRDTQYYIFKGSDQFPFYQVDFCKSEVKLHCSYNRYKAYGLLCRHAFYVLWMNNVKEFPKNYLHKRWLKNVKPSSFGRRRITGASDVVQSEVLELYQIFEYTIDCLVHDLDKLHIYKDKMKELLNIAEIDVPTVPKVSSKVVMSAMLGVDEPENVLIGNPNLSKVKGTSCFSRMKPVAEVTAEELAKRRTCSVCGGKEGHNKRTCTNEPASKKPKVQAAPKEKAAPKQQASQPRRSGLRSSTPK